MWFGPENVPKEMLLPGLKFHRHTKVGSGVTLQEETLRKKFLRNLFLQFTNLFENICSAKI